jgi:hypothetical protein
MMSRPLPRIEVDLTRNLASDVWHLGPGTVPRPQRGVPTDEVPTTRAYSSSSTTRGKTSGSAVITDNSARP